MGVAVAFIVTLLWSFFLGSEVGLKFSHQQLLILEAQTSINNLAYG